MVNIDGRKDYYAELGIASSSGDDEIKKAYRKLAFLYHPDRNKGRESEVITKFQEIQAAHEVLSDPVHRARYDSERRKFASFSASAYGTRRRTATQPTQPPPRPQTHHNPSGSFYARTQKPERPPPPQQHNTYTSGADRFKNFKPPPTAQQKPASRNQNDAHNRENLFTAWQKMKTQAKTETKADGTSSRPSSGTSSAKTAEGAFGKSRRNGFDPNDIGTSHEPPASRSAYRSAYERHVPPPPPTPDTGDDVPFSEGVPRTRAPYASTKGERTSMFDAGLGRSASMREPPSYPRESVRQPQFAADPNSTRQRKSFAGNATRPFATMYTSSEESEVEEIPKSAFRPKGTQRTPPLQTRAERPMFNGHSEDSSPPEQAAPNMAKSRSAETLNTKFSPNQWKGKFDGVGPDIFAPNITKPSRRTSPIRGKPSRTGSRDPSTASQYTQPSGAPLFAGQDTTFNMPSMPPPPPRPNFGEFNRPSSASSANPAKFAPEDWSKTFNDPQWAYPTETSPRRETAPPKRPKAVPRKPTPAPVIDLTEEANDKDKTPRQTKSRYQAFAEDASAENSDAMDIDSTTPPREEPKKPSPSPLRSGHRPIPSVGSDGGIRLSDIGKVAPLASDTNGEGLSSVNDIQNTLPFQSKPSDMHPTKPVAPKAFVYPTVPVPPPAPAVVDDTTFGPYARQMEWYVKKFLEFNQTMLNHFAARQTQLQALEANWITTVGEPTDKMGFQGYMKAVEEDDRAREYWKVGCEKHKKHMLKFKELRQRAIREKHNLFAGRNVTVECPESIARRFPSRDLGGWMRAEGIERLVVDFDEDEVVGLDVGFEVEGRKRGCEVGEGLRKRFCSGF